MTAATRRVRSKLGDTAIRSLVRANPSERDIERTCDDFLELDGWRCVKTDLPHLRGLGVPERGMADRLYIRYGDGRVSQWSKSGANLYAAKCELMWIEWKRKDGQTKQHQRDWHDRERARGGLTLIAGKDFPKTIEGFQAFYRHESGLMRRKI